MGSHIAGCLPSLRLFRKPKPNLTLAVKDSAVPNTCGSNKHFEKGLKIPCDFSTVLATEQLWSLEDTTLPPRYSLAAQDEQLLYRPEVLETIDNAIETLNPELRKLSLQIHDHPELGFHEKYAHDTLTAFLSSHGFSVTKHYLGLDTAWLASFSHGTGGRTMGVNSEMDALPGIGHACGHNLIAINGVGVALALKAALIKHDVPGKIVLLGTPEGGGGKVILIGRGAYEGMDACVMAHPGPGPPHTAGTGPCKAVQRIDVEYFGHTAHASAQPWEGQNALDAAFLAYSAVSVLRQQLQPTYRVHGIVEGRDWAANIIPDYAKMQWAVRAPTWDETLELREKVVNCLRAASLATSTKAEITFGSYTYDLSQNPVLAEAFASVAGKQYGVHVRSGVEGAIGGSTDFGNVSHEVPAIHPSYSIPTKPNGGNHTALFAEAARTQEAHDATLAVTKALTYISFRVLADDDFFEKVKESFEASASLSSL